MWMDDWCGLGQPSNVADSYDWIMMMNRIVGESKLNFPNANSVL